MLHGGFYYWSTCGNYQGFAAWGKTNHNMGSVACLCIIYRRRGCDW